MPVEFDTAFLSDPHAAYAALRSESSAHRAITPDGARVWLVTRYADVRAALADPRLSVDKKHSTTGYAGFSLPPELDANLLNRDGDTHARLRRLIGQAFTPRRAAGLRPHIQHHVDELLSALPRQGTVDLLPALAAPLPITVICDLLGVPEPHRVDFRSWTDAMLAPDPQQPEQARHAVTALQTFLVDLVATKRAAPGEDLLSSLIAEADTHDRLHETELVSAAFLILFAGYENTVHVLGNGLAALLTQPDQLARLRTDPQRIPAAVDEMLRVDPPPQLAIRRFATCDLVLAGETIAAGETVLLSLAAANRDPAVITDPDTVDVDRGCPALHLGFGHGRHYCLGAGLARAEVEITVASLLRAVPDLCLAVDPAELSWRPSFRNRGLHALPVVLTRT